MNKKIFCIFLIFLAGFGFLSAENNDSEEKVMKELCDFRTEIKMLEKEDALLKIDAFIEKFEASDKSCLSEEIVLSFENILIWEKYNLFYEIDIAHPELEGLIKGEYEKVKAFFKAHKKESHDKWLYTTSGDVLSSCMQFLPLTTAMNEGLTVKKYYDDALLQDENFVWALINIGQWYYFAPQINGGGRSKAIKTLEKALENSKTGPEKFNSYLFLSQLYFEDKNSEKCAEFLDECEKLYSGTRCVKQYRFLNENGFSYYDYCLDRKKIDKKLLGK